MSHTRGVGILGALEYFEQISDAGGMQRLKAALTPADRELFFTKSIGGMDWVDYDAYIRLLLAADEVLGKGDHEIIRESSKYEARKSFNGIYRIFLSILSPRFVINKSGMLWRKYYDKGELEVVWIHSNDAAVKMTGFPDIPLHHEISTMAYMEEALILSGCREIHGQHEKCMARGDDHCLFSFQWK